MEHPGHVQQVTVAVGLPGSGKSTWFKTVLAASPPCHRYISRDDLRFMLVGKMWNPKREKAVTDARDTLLRRFLQDGHCVLVDETFLNPKVLHHVKAIAAEYGVPVREKDFTDVDIDVCVERDINRGERAVGAGVIRSLAKQWLRAPRPAPLRDAPDAILCDLDGTLALFGDESPYDRNVRADEPNQAVVRILQRFAVAPECPRIIITSARKEKYRADTLHWLALHDIPHHALYMREEEVGNVKDSVLKRALYEQHIKGKYNVLFVLDDRDQVVDMWRRLGLTCLQVDYGAF